MSVRYNDLIAPLIKSVQELSAENEALRSEVAANTSQTNEISTQANEIAMLKAEMAELKALVLTSTKTLALVSNH